MSQVLDLLNIPLSGRHLIEASAGTGKTYTLENIYLRMILEGEYSVDQILVVTFTEAATRELRARIRQRLYQALHQLKQNTSQNCLTAQILKRSPEPQKLLESALASFDLARISTIHAFCQFTLQTWAFLCQVPFELEVLSDQEGLVKGVVEDFWRRHIYTQSESFLRFGLANSSLSLGTLIAYLRRYNSYSSLKIQPEPEEEHTNIETIFQDWKKSYPDLQKSWFECRDQFQPLIASKVLDGRTYQERYLVKWLIAIDEYFILKTPRLKLPDCFENLCLERLTSKLKKGKSLPEILFVKLAQDFFEAFQQLASSFDTHWLKLLHQLLGEGVDELQKIKSKQGLQSFDDLLKDLLRALQGPRGKELSKTLEHQFPIALVDEFQDTDWVQYQIFEAIYQHQYSGLYYIGDPKQSIYRFRGADIYTYLQVKNNPAVETWTLKTNYRSDATLVLALECLFSLQENPFEQPRAGGINFEPIKAAQIETADALKLENSPLPAIPFWSLAEFELKSDELREKVAQGVASEVVRLLESGCLNEERIQASDIAILVRKGAQADVIESALSMRGVPSTRYGDQSVFLTPEALALEQVLGAIQLPKISNIRAALTSELIALNAAEMRALKIDENGWDFWLDLFRSLHYIWLYEGFPACWQAFNMQIQPRKKLAQMPLAERRITNLRQLVMRLTEQVLLPDMTMSGLLIWFQNQKESQVLNESDYIQPLASEQSAVKILTIHRSKGLEFPLVFCPYLWDYYSFSSSEVLYQDPTTHQYCLDLGSPEQEEIKSMLSEEERAEEIRLSYVALTRARHCVYIVWAHTRPRTKKSSFTCTWSALSYLLTLTDIPLDVDIVKEKVDELSQISAGHIKVHPLKIEERILPHKRIWPEKSQEPGPLPHSNWQLFSYSSLASQYEGAEEEQAYILKSREFEADNNQEGPLNFPRGAHAGEFLHALLEQFDFSIGAHKQVDMLERTCRYFQIESIWKKTLITWLDHIRSRPLSSYDLCLSTVSDSKQIREMAFYYPVQKSNLNEILQILGFPGSTSLELNGLMKGFIDLIFETDGQYFLVDYKSNYLGSDYRDYSPLKLKEYMNETSYNLQYYIYMVALHRFLASRLTDYQPSQHLGGVFYLFLRGMVPDTISQNGIFFVRPPIEKIVFYFQRSWERLNQVLDKLRKTYFFSALDWQLEAFLIRLNGKSSLPLSLAILTVSKYTSEQHACVELPLIAGQNMDTDTEFECCYPEWDPWLEALKNSHIIGAPNTIHPLILDAKGRLYLYRYWDYEARLASNIKMRLGFVQGDFPEQVVLERLFPQQNVLDWQKIAALSAILNKLTLVSGGPGTGKTTTVLKMMLLFLEQGIEKIALAAPTGKAAIRMQEAIKNQKNKLQIAPNLLDKIPDEAQTLHRLLGFRRGSVGFIHNKLNPLDADLIIIDEASMIDMALMTRLFEAIRPETRIILLGDRDQLASVEAGSVLGDLCSSVTPQALSKERQAKLAIHIPDIKDLQISTFPLQDHVILLTHSYRFGVDSGIGNLARAVNLGKSERVKSLLSQNKYNDISFESLPGENEFYKWNQDVISPLKTYLHSNTVAEALETLNTFRILSALKKGPQGVYHLNRLIEALLYGQGLLRKKSGFYHLRPIMILRNDYGLSLFNGDLGVCWNDKGKTEVWFQNPDGSLRALPAKRVPEHETAWAMTIHKSQGSEFKQVLLVLPDHESPILSRELIYTGITRAKDKVVVWGNMQILEAAVKKQVHRTSGLKDYFLGK